MSNIKFNARRMHVRYVRMWGYSLAVAFDLCKSCGWFGDTRAI